MSSMDSDDLMDGGLAQHISGMAITHNTKEADSDTPWFRRPGSKLPYTISKIFMVRSELLERIEIPK